MLSDILGWSGKSRGVKSGLVDARTGCHHDTDTQSDFTFVRSTATKGRKGALIQIPFYADMKFVKSFTQAYFLTSRNLPKESA